jgi:hypothetical protein
MIDNHWDGLVEVAVMTSPLATQPMRVSRASFMPANHPDAQDRSIRGAVLVCGRGDGNERAAVITPLCFTIIPARLPSCLSRVCPKNPVSS